MEVSLNVKALIAPVTALAAVSALAASMVIGVAAPSVSRIVERRRSRVGSSRLAGGARVLPGPAGGK
jgi:hypothetical protein